MKARLKTLQGTLVWLFCFVLTPKWGFSTAQKSNGIPEGAASLVFVFDTTGSMFDDLIQVRAGAAKIVAATLERHTKPLYNYVLIPFHDPGELFREILAIFGVISCSQICLKMIGSFVLHTSRVFV